MTMHTSRNEYFSPKEPVPSILVETISKHQANFVETVKSSEERVQSLSLLADLDRNLLTVSDEKEERRQRSYEQLFIEPLISDLDSGRFSNFDVKFIENLKEIITGDKSLACRVKMLTKVENLMQEYFK